MRGMGVPVARLLCVGLISGMTLASAPTSAATESGEAERAAGEEKSLWFFSKVKSDPAVYREWSRWLFRALEHDPENEAKNEELLARFSGIQSASRDVQPLMYRDCVRAAELVEAHSLPSEKHLNWIRSLAASCAGGTGDHNRSLGIYDAIISDIRSGKARDLDDISEWEYRRALALDALGRREEALAALEEGARFQLKETPRAQWTSKDGLLPVAMKRYNDYRAKFGLAPLSAAALARSPVYQSSAAAAPAASARSPNATSASLAREIPVHAAAPTPPVPATAPSDDFFNIERVGKPRQQAKAAPEPDEATQRARRLAESLAKRYRSSDLHVSLNTQGKLIRADYVFSGTVQQASAELDTVVGLVCAHPDWRADISVDLRFKDTAGRNLTQSTIGGATCSVRNFSDALDRLQNSTSK